MSTLIVLRVASVVSICASLAPRSLHDGAPPTGRDPRAAAPMDASKTALGHANVEISTNATANIKYLYYYVSKGEDRNVTSIRRKEADQAVDEVGRPAAHGSPLISRSISARRSHPPYARQVEEHLNSRVYDWDRTAWSLFPPWRQQYFDGMETVRACGEPSFFVTVTANLRHGAGPRSSTRCCRPGQETTGGAATTTASRRSRSSARLGAS